MFEHNPTLNDIVRLVSTTSARLDLAASCQVLDEILAQRYDRKLFTVLRFIRKDRVSERLYSSDTKTYPLLGRKTTPETVWGKLVLTDGKMMISRNAGDIRDNFSDHETILGLGIDSMINVPILWNGEILGSANVSFADGGYRNADAAHLQALVGIFAPVVAAGMATGA